MGRYLPKVKGKVLNITGGGRGGNGVTFILVEGRERVGKWKWKGLPVTPSYLSYLRQKIPSEKSRNFDENDYACGFREGTTKHHSLEGMTRSITTYRNFKTRQY